jgi:hypothetical protein
VATDANGETHTLGPMLPDLGPFRFTLRNKLAFVRFTNVAFFRGSLKGFLRRVCEAVRRKGEFDVSSIELQVVAQPIRPLAEIRMGESPGGEEYVIRRPFSCSDYFDFLETTK